MARTRDLPPLNSLVHFEAAARLGSFTRAADELNVTQGAVSRQVRKLEETLGCDLFVRAGRRVLLTDEGHNYHVAVADLLDQLSASTRELLGSANAGQVTVATSGALATFYLLPRIPAFRRAHDDIRIRIVARDQSLPRESADVDLSLFYHRTAPADDCGAPLFGEAVFPVCSPEYLEANRERLQGPDWFDRDLIWLETSEDWINWPEWLSRMGLEPAATQHRFVVNHYSMVVQAAVAGQGIGLGWAGLVEGELANRTLVRPVGLSLQTTAGFFLIPSGSRRIRPEAERFRHWLENQRD